MSTEHSDSDGFVDLGGYGFYATEEVDMGMYSIRKPLKNKKIDLDRETGDWSVVKKHPLEEEIPEGCYKGLKGLGYLKDLGR